MFEFHILTLGRFSRNRFWGELETQAYRDALCTTALIKGKQHILTDPSLPPGEMAKVLFDRSGLRPGAIGAVFITHHHGDHFVGLELFEKARWYMGALELAAMKESQDARTRELAGNIIPLEQGVLEGIEPFPLPGHTSGSMGLLFESPDGRVIVSGDAVMSRDFFRHEAAYFNAVDPEQSRRSIRKIAESADIVVPGHDNYFIVHRENAGN
ncbi:MAG: MBL fold metallo-hydrolase [Treponema sp.]|nr:MBL fold metallo-hydrolase [Treponema sp.]